MNINQKIDLLGKAGLQGHKSKINELTDTVNWLMGMRVVSGTISEGGRGPVIDTGGGFVSTGAQPWMADPDGNAAGWKLVTCLDLATNQRFDVWIWTGQITKNVQPIQWMWDTNNNQADWLIGAQGELWGTGTYPPGASVPYQQVKFASPANDISPQIWTGSLVKTPIVPPSSPPVLFLRLMDDPSGPLGVAPTAPIWMPSIGSPEPSLSINFNWQITYDGTIIFNQSGSSTFYHPKVYVPLSKTGWTFDPTGLSGYTKGENAWIYLYNGTISPNTNPPIIQTFTYTTTNSATVSPNIFEITLYTG